MLIACRHITSILLLSGLLLFSQSGEASVVVRQQMDPGIYAGIKGGRVLYLECHLPKGDASRELLAPYLSQSDAWENYKDISAVAIPYHKLNAQTQRKLLETLFPDDYVDEKGWWHTVVFDGSTGAETWHAIALWLTGNGDTYKEIMALQENASVGINLKQGQLLLVPRRMLREELNAISPVKPRRIAPPPPVAPPVLAQSVAGNTAPPLETKPETVLAPSNPLETEKTATNPQNSTSTNREPMLVALNPDMEIFDASGESTPTNNNEVMDDISAPPVLPADLAYGEDAYGAFAAYKMKPGDALYSSVVVRFTDFSENAEIHSALDVIQKRSGIDDPRRMKAGHSVKIPMEMLADRYHPQGSEQRALFEVVQTEMQRVGAKRSVAPNLQGVVLIMDPGHGGRDQGAAPWAKMGIFEDEVVYDIACRIKKIIEEETQAKIYMTLEDLKQGYTPRDLSAFTHDTNEVLLTNPPYNNEDARISANLRWYLANELYRNEVSKGTPSDKVVFVSLHCDALYTPQLRGAMVYVPGAQYRRDSEQPSGAVYSSYQEVKQQPMVRTTYAQRVEDEALSRAFAETLLYALQNNDPPIKVHDTGDPIRNVIRQSGGRAYVPAVLRNCMVPTKVLLEAANLTNVIDRQRVADPQWRQYFAEAFVAGLNQHFASQGDSVQVAAIR